MFFRCICARWLSWRKLRNYPIPGTKTTNCQIMWRIACLIMIPFDHGSTIAAEKAILGAVEEVVVLPWNVKLLARIDTGAATSSVDARDIRIKDNTVQFKIFEPGEGHAVTLPIVRWGTVRTSEGDARRPVVRLQLCIGSQLLSTTVNLNDRLKMEYALLIGRNALAGRFLVDVSRRKMLPPSCSQGHTR